MKNAIVALAVMLGAVSSFAGGSSSVTFESVTDRVTKEKTDVQYYRMSNDLGNGLSFNVQARNGRAVSTGALSQSLEGGLSSSVGPVFVGAGLGHDFGVKEYNYGYVIGGVAAPVGPVVANAGIKYSAGLTGSNPSSTLVFAGVSYPVTKTVAVEGGLTRSYRDFKENALNVGIKFNY